MKKIIFAFWLLLLTLSVSAEVYYSCDFGTGFNAGSLHNQNGWKVTGDDGYSKPENVATVGDYHGQRCVKVERAEGWDGVIYNGVSGVPEQSFVKVSFKMFWEATSSANSVYFAGQWWSRPFILSLNSDNNSNFYVYKLQDDVTLVPQALRNKTFPKETWLEVSYILDYRSGVCYNLIIGSEEFDLTSIPLRDSGKTVTSFDIVGNAGLDICLDDIKVETVDRPVGPRLIVPKDSDVADSKANSYKLNIINAGSGKLDYNVTVTPQPEWLTIPSPTGSCADKATINLNFNRSLMETNVYPIVVNVDAGAAGRRDLLLKVQSKGAVLFYDFDPPLLYPGELHGQDGWRGIGDDGYYYPENSMVVTNVSYADSSCAFVKVSRGWDGYNCPVSCGTDDVVKISMKMYKSSTSTQDAFFLRSDWWHMLFEFYFWRYEDSFYVYKYNDGPRYNITGFRPMPLDQWIDLSFTLDMRLYRMTEFQLYDFKTNFTEGFELKTNDNGSRRNLNSLAFLCGGAETTDADWLIDDLRVIIEERPKVPQPILPPIFSVDAEKEQFSVKALNSGGRGMNYTLEILDLPEAIVPVAPSGRLGSSANLLFNVNASKLEDGFHRGRLVFNYKGASGSGNGVITSAFTVAKGGFFYSSEFEGEYYHLGNLGGQDTWSAGTEAEKPPQVVYDDGVQAAYFPEIGFAKTQLLIPENSDFTFKARIFMENNNAPAYAVFSQIDDTGLMPFYLIRDVDLRHIQLGYFQDGSDKLETLTFQPLGEWLDFSYSMKIDPAEYYVTSVSLGDFSTNFVPETVFLRAGYEELPIENLTVRLVNQDDIAPDNKEAGFYVDNFIARDSSIPEPSLLLLMLTLGAAFFRKR